LVLDVALVDAAVAVSVAARDSLPRPMSAVAVVSGSALT
jgi:hypothetical protein